MGDSVLLLMLMAMPDFGVGVTGGAAPGRTLLLGCEIAQPRRSQLRTFSAKKNVATPFLMFLGVLHGFFLKREPKSCHFGGLSCSDPLRPCIPSQGGEYEGRLMGRGMALGMCPEWTEQKRGPCWTTSGAVISLSRSPAELHCPSEIGFCL